MNLLGSGAAALAFALEKFVCTSSRARPFKCATGFAPPVFGLKGRSAAPPALLLAACERAALTVCLLALAYFEVRGLVRFRSCFGRHSDAANDDDWRITSRRRH